MLYKKKSRRKITAKCLEGVGHFAVIFGHKKSPQEGLAGLALCGQSLK